MDILSKIYGWLWGLPLISLVLFVGIFFTVASGFFQFRHLGHLLKNTMGQMLRKRGDKEQEKATEEKNKGILTPFQAVASAIGGAVGVGNIGGVATAIATGGPGAVFWIWVCSLFGMLTKMVEVTLAVYYRSTDEEGNPYGGPTYYMEKGLGAERKFKPWIVFALIFGVGIFLPFFTGVQNYTVSEAVGSTFGINVIAVGVFYFILCRILVAGGIKSVGKFASYLVPFMCLFYVIGGLVILAMDYKSIPGTFGVIFHAAFNGKAAIGGFAGATFSKVIRLGVARSIYSNEAGFGTSPMVHSTAKTDHPIKQGLWGSFEVFVDTIIVCTITALVIINTGVWSSGDTGAVLTLSAFELKFGMIGRVFVATSVFLFGLTTTSGWYAYYEIVLRHLCGANVKLKTTILKLYRLLYNVPTLLLTIIAATYGLSGGVVWQLVDITTSIPTFINLIVILCLYKPFLRLMKDYKARYMGIGTVDPDFKLFYEDNEMRTTTKKSG